MNALVPSQPWHAEGVDLNTRMGLMHADLARRGWRIVRRPKWSTRAFKGTSMTFHPLRIMFTRAAVDLLDDEHSRAEATLYAHELTHIIQGAGSRVLWTLRYVLSRSFRRAVEEEAFAHGLATMWAMGANRWNYEDPAVLTPLYLLKRDETTRERVHQRAVDLLASAQMQGVRA
jgi:hypothetical protein